MKKATASSHVWLPVIMIVFLSFFIYPALPLQAIDDMVATMEPKAASQAGDLNEIESYLTIGPKIFRVVHAVSTADGSRIAFDVGPYQTEVITGRKDEALMLYFKVTDRETGDLVGSAAARTNDSMLLTMESKAGKFTSLSFAIYNRQAGNPHNISSAEPIDIQDMGKRVSSLIGKPIVFNDGVRGKVQVTLNQSLSAHDAYETFRAAAKVLNLEVKEDDGTIFVTPL